MSSDNVEKLLTEMTTSLSGGSFVKMTLGKSCSQDKTLKKIQIRPISTKKGDVLLFQYKYEKRDIAKNFAFDEAVTEVGSLLRSSFLSANLFTTKRDFQLEINKKGNSHLTSSKPTVASRPSLSHDREKNLAVDPGAAYLAALGVTTDKGDVKDKQRDKWKQINKFVEILDSLYRNSPLNGSKKLSILDMGSGKGYLTFAAYDHFANALGLEVSMIGVEERTDLVETCGSIADACGFEGLKFVQGRIEDFDSGSPDILIALHACNTATDDAIFKGISGKATLIVTAPCCHQEVRPQMKAPAVLAGVLSHGILLEREAESVTDGLRALLLEKSGYEAKVFEFISSEHTPKNNMIVGTRSKRPRASAEVAEEISNLKSFYGIEHQRLDGLLASK